MLTVGEHLADQLLVPFALAGSGVLRASRASLHTRTNAEVIARFLPVMFDIDGDQANGWTLRARSK